MSNKQPAKNPKRFQVEGRLAFAKLDKPVPFDENDPKSKPRYSAAIIIPKSDKASYDKAVKAMYAAAAEKWTKVDPKKAFESLFKKDATALIDGDEKNSLRGDSPVDGYDDAWVINAHATEKNPPSLIKTINGKNVLLERDTSEIYSGCYCRFSLEVWPQDNNFGKRLNVTLRGVQFLKHGDPFATSNTADVDEFEPTEDAGDMPDFDDDDTPSQPDFSDNDF